MSDEIIDLHRWFETPAGAYLLDWERAQFHVAVADIFGYHALQLGVPKLDALHTSRIHHQWLAQSQANTSLYAQKPRVALVTEFGALPFPASSLDLVVLPHSLEVGANPHATLREVERVLVPDGRVVISGLNPFGLWGLQHARTQVYRRLGWGASVLPAGIGPIGYWRLCDWLRLLSFDVEHSSFGCYRPALHSAKWLQRFAWMDSTGPKWWPIFGSAYFLVAVKRVRGMRLLGPAWSARPVRVGKAVPLAKRLQDRCEMERNK